MTGTFHRDNSSAIGTVFWPVAAFAAMPLSATGPESGTGEGRVRGVFFTGLFGCLGREGQNLVDALES